MGTKKHIRKWLFIALWGIAVCAALFFVLVAFRTANQENCTAINVTVNGAGTDRLITEAEIKKIVNDEGVQEATPVSQINLRTLEEKLVRNPWIKKAELYIDKNAALNIQVTENTPVMRAFDIKGNNYYLDASGTMMPAGSAVAAKLPVFTGLNPADSVITGMALALAAYINNNPFWQAQVQQVDIIKEHGFVLVPSLGSQLIYFGDTSLMEDKFNRLYSYFTKVAPKSGFNRFESLNVQYAGQLVAVNKNTSGVAIDSASAKRLVRNLIEQGTRADADSGRITNAPAQGDSLLTTGNTTTAATPQPKPATPAVRAAANVRTPPKPGVRSPAARPAVTPRTGTRVTTPPKPAAPRRQPRAVMRRPGR